MPLFDCSTRTTEELIQLRFNYVDRMVDSIADLSTPTVMALASALKKISAEIKKREEQK